MEVLSKDEIPGRPAVVGTIVAYNVAFRPTISPGIKSGLLIYNSDISGADSGEVSLSEYFIETEHNPVAMKPCAERKANARRGDCPILAKDGAVMVVEILPFSAITGYWAKRRVSSVMYLGLVWALAASICLG